MHEEEVYILRITHIERLIKPVFLFNENFYFLFGAKLDTSVYQSKKIGNKVIFSMSYPFSLFFSNMQSLFSSKFFETGRKLIFLKKIIKGFLEYSIVNK